jgi:hypothetical protein
VLQKNPYDSKVQTSKLAKSKRTERSPGLVARVAAVCLLWCFGSQIFAGSNSIISHDIPIRDISLNEFRHKPLIEHIGDHNKTKRTAL